MTTRIELPSFITTPLGFFDPGTIEGLTHNDAMTTGWARSAGTVAEDAAVDGDAPLYRDGRTHLHGKPTVRYNTSNTRLELNNAAYNTASATYVMCIQADDIGVGAPATTSFINRQNTQASGLAIAQYGGTAYRYMAWTKTAAAPTVLVEAKSTAPSDQQMRVVALRMDGTAGTLELFVDGHLQQAVTGLGPADTASFGGLAIGNHPTAARSGDFELGAIALWGEALSDAELQTVSNLFVEHYEGQSLLGRCEHIIPTIVGVHEEVRSISVVYDNPMYPDHDMFFATCEGQLPTALKGVHYWTKPKNQPGFAGLVHRGLWFSDPANLSAGASVIYSEALGKWFTYYDNKQAGGVFVASSASDDPTSDWTLDGVAVPNPLPDYSRHPNAILVGGEISLQWGRRVGSPFAGISTTRRSTSTDGITFTAANSGNAVVTQGVLGNSDSGEASSPGFLEISPGRWLWACHGFNSLVRESGEQPPHQVFGGITTSLDRVGYFPLDTAVLNSWTYSPDSIDAVASNDPQPYRDVDGSIWLLYSGHPGENLVPSGYQEYDAAGVCARKFDARYMATPREAELTKTEIAAAVRTDQETELAAALTAGATATAIDAKLPADTTALLQAIGTLTTVERDTLAAVVDAQLLDAGDATDLIASIVARIGNTNVDEAALVGLIRGDIERVGGLLAQAKASSDANGSSLQVIGATTAQTNVSLSTKPDASGVQAATEAAIQAKRDDFTIAGGTAAVPTLADVSGGGGGGGVDVSQVETGERRVVLKNIPGKGLVGECPRTIKVGEDKLWSIDFREDMPVNGRFTGSPAVTLHSGPTGGITFTVAEEGYDKSLMKIKPAGVTAGTYVIRCAGSYAPNGEATIGDVTVTVVDP